MPIYEYACKNCGHTLDALQKMSDEPLLGCPECDELQLKRLISAPRFRLKGEGWYETDFKKDNQRNLSKSDTEPAKTDKSDKGDKSDKSDKKKGPAKGADKAKSSTSKANGKSDSK